MFAPQRILVPTDFSPSAEVALQHAKSLATAYGSSLTVLHVMDDPLPGFKMPDHVCSIKPIREQLEREAAEHLDGLLTADERQKFRAECLAAWGNPYGKILEYTEAHPIDLIVMGTHGRGAIGHFFMGSVAERVVRMAKCPVLTVRSE
ncbi:MAG: universal stress protein [Planctomycetes bacterium]|nr:universal stress protein [Planctomycetota bacterium]